MILQLLESLARVDLHSHPWLVDGQSKAFSPGGKAATSAAWSDCGAVQSVSIAAMI